MHVLSDLPTQMQKIVTVTFVADNLKWSPAVLIVDDKQFVKLNKWDPQLTHFIRGRHQRLRDGKSEKVHINVAFWDVLHEARRAAMNTALATALGWLKQKRSCKHSDKSVLPPVLSMSVQCSDGFTRELEVLPGWCRKEFWIEATTDTMEFIRKMISDEVESCTWSTFCQKGVSKCAVSSGGRKRKRGRPRQRDNTSNSEDDHEDAADTEERDDVRSDREGEDSVDERDDVGGDREGEDIVNERGDVRGDREGEDIVIQA